VLNKEERRREEKRRKRCWIKKRGEGRTEEEKGMK